MGPIIILDKSAIQGLSYKEILFLYKHYYINITPILVMEILADLKKVAASPMLSEGQVARLARKLLGGDAGINMNYRTLCRGSLLGHDVPMRGACLISGGTSSPLQGWATRDHHRHNRGTNGHHAVARGTIY